MKVDFSKTWIHYVIAVLYSVLFSILVIMIGNLGIKTLIGAFAISCPSFLFGIHAIMPEAAHGVKLLPSWYRRILASFSFIIPSFTSFAIGIQELHLFRGSKVTLEFDKSFWIIVIICYLLLYKFFIVSAWVYEGYNNDKRKARINS